MEHQPAPARRWRRTALPLLLTAVAVAGAVVQQAVPSNASAAAPARHRDTPTSRLICSGHGTLTTDKPITNTTTTISGTGTGTIDKCFPKNGGPTNLVSGTIVGIGTGTGSCNAVGSYTGTATIVWYDGPNRTGTVVGTSRITTNGTQGVEGDPVDHEVVTEPDATASLDSSVFPGAAVTGSGFPTSDISDCAAGLSSVSGTFTLRFNELL